MCLVLSGLNCVSYIFVSPSPFLPPDYFCLVKWFWDTAALFSWVILYIGRLLFYSLNLFNCAMECFKLLVSSYIRFLKSWRRCMSASIHCQHTCMSLLYVCHTLMYVCVYVSHVCLGVSAFLLLCMLFHRNRWCVNHELHCLTYNKWCRFEEWNFIIMNDSWSVWNEVA